MTSLFAELEAIAARPEPFSFYTAADLWTEPHLAQRMLDFHLDPAGDVASRNQSFIAAAVEWITTQFQIGPGVRVADFGCGPGLYAQGLAQKGAAVTGLDFSANSIAYARAQAARAGLSIDYRIKNYLEYETDTRFDLILMIMCDFCALSPAQRGRMLAKFAGLLAEGGSILLDVYSLNAFGRRQEAAVFGPNLMDGFWSPQPYHGFLNTHKYVADQVVLDKYTLVEADRQRVVYNWLQYFSPGDLAREFATAGLAVRGFLGSVAGAAFDPQADEFAVIAQKP